MKSGRTSSDEVEQMLREAEDEVMLKLNLNSHMTHASSSDLDPDLNHRFQALRSGSAQSRKPETSKTKSSDAGKVIDQSSILKEESESDLFARFVALKSSMPKPALTSSSSRSACDKQVGIPDQISNLIADSLTNNEDDEVQKIIMWAMDAARLDPSPSSDDEEDCDGNNDIESDSGVDGNGSHEQSRKRLPK